MEVTKEMLEEANRYWEATEERIIKIAAEMGVILVSRLVSVSSGMTSIPIIIFSPPLPKIESNSAFKLCH